MSGTTGKSVTVESKIDQEKMLLVLSALGQQTRLDTLRLLARIGDEGMVAGEIAKALDAPHNTLSTHLAILQRAGLINSSRSGRNIIYVINPDCMSDLIAFLLSDCCGDMPEKCLPESLILRGADGSEGQNTAA